MKHLFLFFVFLFGFSLSTFAQKQGKITYKNSLSKKQNNSYLLFRQDTMIGVLESYSSFNNTSSVYLRTFIKEKCMISAILDHKHDSGKKENVIYVDHSLDSQKVSINYIEEYKEILGFKCQKAYVKTLFYIKALSETIERNYVVYFTPEIKNLLSEFQGLKGMALEYAELQGEKKLFDNQAIDIQYDIKLPQALTLQSLYPDYKFKDSQEVEKGKH